VTKTRTIEQTCTLTENLTQPSLIIGPTKTRFPVIDFVLSCPGKCAPVVAFQYTRQQTSRRQCYCSVRALYDLRSNHLHVQDDHIFNIYIVCPSTDNNMLAARYASRSKEEFLEGSLNFDLHFDTKTIQVPCRRRKQMWSSTNTFVLGPTSTWQEYITDYLSKLEPAVS
jgi:hypothetical protein